MSPTNANLDSEMLGSLKELLGPKFSELVNTYIADSGQRMARLKTAVAVTDYYVIRHEAHGIKGSSRNIGANTLAELCAEMETKGKTENPKVEQLFASIEQHFAAVCEELKGFL